MRIVDAQIHLWTNNKAPAHHPHAPFPIETALAGMDAAGVTAAINCPPFWDMEAIAYGAIAATAHPERFATLGWFQVEAEADETMVEKLLAMSGMLGLRLLFFTPEAIQALKSDKLNWLWRMAHERELPVAFAVPPTLLSRIGEIAERHSKLRVVIDHLAVSPFETLPAAGAHFDALRLLARHANVAIKATAVPSMSRNPFPFTDTHSHLHSFFDAFGAHRMFWGTDITRMQPTWSQCIQLFTEELPWLKGRDLELVMGDAVVEWLDWH